jgi:3-oxoacyl-[acyl-carrier protein] reductase
MVAPNRLANGTVVDSCPVGDAVRSNPPKDEGKRTSIGGSTDVDGLEHRLQDRVAVVTGASKGIGAAIAKAFADEGASLVVNYATSRHDAEAVVSGIASEGGTAVAVAGDVSKAAEARAITDAAVEHYGHLDILVNNAGVYEFAPVEDVTEKQFHRMFDINVLGLLLTTQAALRHMGAGASIINVGSAASHVTPPETVVYTATKGAVDAITGVLAKELGPKQIRVNSINPGFVETEGTDAAGVTGSDFGRELIEHTVLGRAGQPEDIASVATFLASDDAAWVTGEQITAAGGLR